MIRILFTLLALCYLINEESFAQRQLWTDGTAQTLSKSDFRLAVFHPSVYGLSNTSEIAAGGLYFPLAPNFSWKKKWYEKKAISIATRHSVYYPTPLLRQLSKSSSFENIPIDTLIPNAFGFKSEVIFSYGYGAGTCPAFTSEPFNRNNTFKGHTGIWSLKLGVQTGVSIGEHPFPVIEEAIIYQRTVFLNNQLSYYAGIDWDGRLLNYSDIKVDLDYIYLNKNSWALEHKVLVNWYHGWRFFHLLFGYHASFVQTPTGNIFFVGPVIDFLWTMKRDKIQKGLFKDKMF